jgi:hypothetical protein
MSICEGKFLAQAYCGRADLFCTGGRVIKSTYSL